LWLLASLLDVPNSGTQEKASTPDSQQKEVKTAPPVQHAPTIPIVQASTTKKNIQKQHQKNSGGCKYTTATSGNNDSNVSAPNGSQSAEVILEIPR